MVKYKLTKKTIDKFVEVLQVEKELECNVLVHWDNGTLKILIKEKE